MKVAEIRAKKPRGRITTTQSRHGLRRYPNLLKDLPGIVHPNQVWVSDIIYIRLADDSFVFLAIVMDVFTRVIRGRELGTDLTHQLALAALNKALKKGDPEIHHSDQGVVQAQLGTYVTPMYTDTLTSHNVAISMSDKGMAWQNGYAERFMCMLTCMLTIKKVEVYLTEYLDYNDALANIGPFIDAVYNKKRIHSALDYIPPAQFEKPWNAKNHSLNSPKFLS